MRIYDISEGNSFCALADAVSETEAFFGVGVGETLFPVQERKTETEKVKCVE